EYVVALSHRPANAAAVGRAAPVYQANCAICHGPEGKGMPAQGAPDLTDADWLYGSARADIKGQIWNGRGGVMPTWEHRFDPETIKALAVYIHANAAGQ
ncbi:MAG TPA: c-type cytochrome, partial [Phenylobacterium sp.]|nr:c-type cytochrome [Phenylobacterium sp.]